MCIVQLCIINIKVVVEVEYIKVVVEVEYIKVVVEVQYIKVVVEVTHHILLRFGGVATPGERVGRGAPVTPPSAGRERRVRPGPGGEGERKTFLH